MQQQNTLTVHRGGGLQLGPNPPTWICLCAHMSLLCALVGRALPTAAEQASAAEGEHTAAPRARNNSCIWRTSSHAPRLIWSAGACTARRASFRLCAVLCCVVLCCVVLCCVVLCCVATANDICRIAERLRAEAAEDEDPADYCVTDMVRARRHGHGHGHERGMDEGGG